MYPSVEQQQPIYSTTGCCPKKFCNSECNSLTFTRWCFALLKILVLLGFVCTTPCLDVLKKVSTFPLLSDFSERKYSVTYHPLKSVPERNDLTPNLPLHEHFWVPGTRIQTNRCWYSIFRTRTIYSENYLSVRLVST